MRACEIQVLTYDCTNYNRKKKNGNQHKNGKH